MQTAAADMELATGVRRVIAVFFGRELGQVVMHTSMWEFNARHADAVRLKERLESDFGVPLPKDLVDRMLAGARKRNRVCVSEIVAAIAVARTA